MYFRLHMSIYRQLILEKRVKTHSEKINFSDSAINAQGFHFKGDSVIKSWKGTRQRDSESPALFLDTIQDLVVSMNWRKPLVLWRWNLSHDYKILLKHLKKIVDAENQLRVKIKTTNLKLFF